MNMTNSVPGLIEPIGIQIDIEKLKQAVAGIYKATGFEESMAAKTGTRTLAFNFNHPVTIPDSIENIHFGALATGEDLLRSKFGMTTSDFTQMDPMVTGTYLETVYNLVQVWHQAHRSNLGRLNRLHGAVLANGAGYQLHIDSHTTIRYHIALTTNEYCYMLCKQNNMIQSVHIPADGQVWQLDTRVLHTALNIAPKSLKDNLRSHLIFSVSK